MKIFMKGRPRYNDTASGAIKALREMSIHGTRGASATADPQVQGVWVVYHEDGQSIVYLGGYKDPLGRVRESDDFEDVEIKPEVLDDLQNEFVN